MKQLIMAIFAIFAFNTAHADRVGNGGGAWACKVGNEIQKLHLVDFFEAEAEWGWTLKSYSGALSEIQIVADIKDRIRTVFPELATELVESIDFVIRHMRPIPADLEKVPDVSNRSRPEAIDCNGQDWDYEQLANFDKANHIIISQSLWNNPLTTLRIKAGLIIHEAIYYWMRNTYGDTTSQRARFITGILFSTETAQAIQERVAMELQRPVDNTPPDNEDQSNNPVPINERWACNVMNAISEDIYIGLAKERQASKDLAMSKCTQAGHGVHCNEIFVECEAITTMNPRNKFCRIENDFIDMVFTASGRNKVEAHYNTVKQCLGG